MNSGLYFGKEMKEMRKQAKMSQQQIADKYLYDRTAISLYEHDKSKTPDDLIINLAIDLDDRDTLGEFFKQKGLEIVDALQQKLANKLTQAIQLFDQERPSLFI